MEEITSGLPEVKKEALEALYSLLRIPSVSSRPSRFNDLIKCADELERLLKSKGFKTNRLDCSGFPALIAETGPAKPPTLLFYGHYDVQAANKEDGWTSEPFDPVEREGNIICRGASDDKGQIISLLYGIEAYRRARGELPCKVKLLFEGAEEVGSPGFEQALLDHRDLVHADMAIVADCGRLVAERPSLICGLRGLAYLEVFLKGPKEDLHSGSYGGAVDNPALVLANMLSALKDADRRIAIPGFYHDVVPPTSEDLKAVEDTPFQEEPYRERIGVPKLAGESGCDTLTRLWFRPSLDINGITAGFQGTGAKTVLPAKASCKLSCRIVPNQRPGKVLDLLEGFFEEICPSTCGVSFTRHASAMPVKLKPSGPQAERVFKALKRAFDAEPMKIFEGATVPVVETFAHKLGIPPFPIGFGQSDDGAHGPDEKFAVGDIEKTILTTAFLLEEQRP